jgi:hypothetical protein
MRAEDLPIPQPPYIKGKGFDAAPLISKGIPAFADASRDPKVIGTPEYELFWQEQLYRCINGYNTGGIYIPGRFYYYMNFNAMSTIHGVINPDFCDLHLQLAYIIEWCKAHGKNLIIGKKRRAGISEFTQKAVIDYGFRFIPAYKAGVAAGQKKYAEDFMKKRQTSDALLANEFKMNILLNNPDEVVSGYKMYEDGKEVKKGIGTEIIVRTMHNNPNMFKGLYLNDAVAEEAGEFDNLCEFISATNDCLMDGDTQVGTFYIYGTGGNVNKGSKDFKKVWENPDDYNAVKFLIAGDRFKKPYYGGATRYGKDVTNIPYLLKEYKPYQLIGVEDRKAAMENIMEERARLKKGDLKKYLEHLQNNPIDEAEIFRKTFSNHFDVQRLNDQQDEISRNRDKYSKYKLDWVLNAEGQRANPLQVKAIPARDTDMESECVLILDEYHPDKKYKNLYVAGIDPYDQDVGVSKSLGAMCVITRNNPYGIPFKMPVAVIRTRPKRKEMFFDMCLKLSVYYNLVGNVLGDKAGSSGMINWFKDHNCQKYLALRPTKFESSNSQQSHEYWMSINSYSKPLMVGLMQTAVYDYAQNIWFKELISELQNYDEVEIGSDNDLADAYGIALVQDVSVNVAPRDDSFVQEEDPFSLGGWDLDKNGNVIPALEFKKPEDPEEDFQYFGLR